MLGNAVAALFWRSIKQRQLFRFFMFDIHKFK
jgi:hypothetical protein